MSFTIDCGATMRRWTLGLTLLSTVAAPVWAAQTPARAGTARLRCVNCDPADSLVQRQKSVTLKLDSLRDVLMHKRLSDVEREILLREMTLTLRALQEAFGERAAFVAATEPARRAFAEAQEPRGESYGYAVRSGPKGYLGVSFEGVNYEYNTDTDHIIRFYQYPKIALVEPASPAELAGIIAGDTLLALNDLDVVEAGEMSLTRLLVPDKRLNVIVKRNGDSKRLAVVVGRPPAYFVRRTTPLPRSGQATATIVEAEPGARGRVSVGARGAGGAVSVFQFGDANGLGGARMENVTEGLGKALRVSSGVLVTAVQAGTPAYESGLRDGDVIRRAAGESVSSISELRSILRRSNGEGVRIQIVRDRRNRELTLRW